MANEFYRAAIVIDVTGEDNARHSLDRVKRFIQDTERRGKVLDRMKMSPTVSLVDRVSSPLKKIETSLKRVSAAAAGARERISGIATSVPGMLGLGAVTAGPGVIIGRMISTAAGFEQAMANVASVAGAGRDEMIRLTNAALDMGRTTQFKASEAADALYYLASAGFTVDQQIGALSGTLSLAAATQADLAFTAETVAATLSGFGLQAEDANRVANVFAATISRSQATISKLSDSMRYVGPIAGSFGMTIESTAAALGILYNAGLRGEQAGTTLRGALVSLANPAGQTRDALKRLGLSAHQVNPALHSIADIVETLEKRGVDTATAMQLFGQEAGSGMTAMIKQGSAALRKMEKDITNTNKAAEMSEMQMDTLSGSVKYLQSAWEAVSISLGLRSIPGLKRLSEYVKRVIDDSDGLAAAVGERLNRVFNRFADILESPEFQRANWGGKIGIVLNEMVNAGNEWLTGEGGQKVIQLGADIGTALGKGVVSAFTTALAEHPVLRTLIMGAVGRKYAGTPGLLAGAGAALILEPSRQAHYYHKRKEAERKAWMYEEHEARELMRQSSPDEPLVRGGTIGPAKHALGGIFAQPHLGLVAEAGPEAIIPLSERFRGRALGLWADAGARLGAPLAAAGAGGGTVINVYLDGAVQQSIEVKNAGDVAEVAEGVAAVIATKVRDVLQNLAD
ncbi:MAG: phage tail tape measure protein [Bacillota bacterium]